MKAKYTVKSLEDVFEEDKPKTIEETVYEAIKKSKDGLTNTEVSITTGIRPRRVREATQGLFHQGRIRSEICRCKHTPIHYTL